MTRLDRVATVQARIGWKALTADEYVDDGYAFLATPNIKNREVDFENVNYITPFRYEESPELKLQLHDVLLAKDGSTLGIVNCVRSLPRPATVNGSIAVLRPHAVEPVFLTYWLQGAVIQSRIQQLKDGMGVPHLFQRDIRKLPVPELDPDEQRRIADFLDDRVGRIDGIVDRRRQQVSLAEERFVSRRRAAVLPSTSDIRRTQLAWCPVVPSERPLRRLSRLAKLGTGHTPSKNEPEYWVDCEIPWLSTADVHHFRRDEIDTIVDTEFEISELGLANSAAVLHPKGTIALSRTASAGFSVMMGTNMATSQDYVTWTCGDDLMPQYLLQVLRVMRPYLLGYLSMGTTHKTIYFPDLMDLAIPHPPLAMQRATVESIAEAAAERSRSQDLMRRQVGLLQEYKQSLITAAVTGELDVTTAGSGVPG